MSAVSRHPVFSIVPEVVANAIRKENKQHMEWKVERKIVCRSRYCVHGKPCNVQNSNTKITELIGKITEYKVNRRKNFYISSEQLENENFKPVYINAKINM